MSRPTYKRKKSTQWAQRHVSDRFVKMAVQSSYRARAVFKLEEIDNKYRLIKPGMQILDLGAAPGSWSQLSSKKTGAKGLVVAIDLLEIKPIENVEIIQGNFCDENMQALMVDKLGNRSADLILSDLSPDLTGIRITDQANMEFLLENVVSTLDRLLRPGGDLLVKVFEGQVVADIRKSLNSLFQKNISIKPGASRKQSREFYLLAKNFQPQ